MLLENICRNYYDCTTNDAQRPGQRPPQCDTPEAAHQFDVVNHPRSPSNHCWELGSTPLSRYALNLASRIFFFEQDEVSQPSTHMCRPCLRLNTLAFRNVTFIAIGVNEATACASEARNVLTRTVSLTDNYKDQITPSLLFMSRRRSDFQFFSSTTRLVVLN